MINITISIVECAILCYFSATFVPSDLYAH
jgi:hypothetical protein